MRRRRSIFFLSGFLAAGILVLLIGWFTGVRVVMHSVLISLFVTAFLPFVIAAALLLFVIVLTAIGMIASDGGGGEIAVQFGASLAEEGISTGVETAVPKYYRLLAKIRHPAIWGAVMGMLAGGLLLWGVLSWLILPREIATSQILADTATRLMELQRESGKFPNPTADGYLNARDVGQQEESPVRDAFGHPLLFTTTGRSIFASFTLRSYGFDGKPGRDDFCVSGAAKGAEWAGRIESLLSHIRIGKDGKPPKLKDRLKTLRALRCEEK